AALRRDDAAQLPSIECALERAVQARGEWQLPYVANHQSVPHVVNAAGLFVLASMPRVLGKAAIAVGFIFLIVDHVRPVVCRGQADALRKAVLEMRLQAMIRAVAIGAQQADAREALVGTPRLNIAGTGIGAVEIQLAAVEEGSLGPHVAH